VTGFQQVTELVADMLSDFSPQNLVADLVTSNRIWKLASREAVDNHRWTITLGWLQHRLKFIMSSLEETRNRY